MKDATAILMALKPKAKDDDELKDEESSEAEGGSDYGSELAGMLGISDDDKDDFIAALRGFVKGC